MLPFLIDPSIKKGTPLLKKKYIYIHKQICTLYRTEQCDGSGSVEPVSVPWIRIWIRIKKWLDPESG